MNQYDIDKERFAELFSKFTGVSLKKINSFLKENNVRNIFEHPSSLDVTPAQYEKIKQLKELQNLYGNLREYDKSYIINSSSKAGQYFSEYFRNVKDKEMFVCAFLDNQNKILCTKVIAKGTVNEAPVYPREVTKLALLYDANSVMLAHNHPGGSLSPSNADMNVTQNITNALATQKIQVLDHIIVGENGYCSFAEKGYRGLTDTLHTYEQTQKYSVKEKLKNLKDNKKNNTSKNIVKNVNVRY